MSIPESQMSAGDGALLRCITCSDEALRATVLHVDGRTQLALVAVGDSREEVDVSLVDSVSPGDLLLVHGGVALSRIDREQDER